MRYWKIAPGGGADYWEEFRENRYVGVWWNKLGDLRLVPDDDFESLFKEKHPDSASTQLRVFYFEIEEGDIIVVYGDKHILGVARAGPYFFKIEKDQDENEFAGHRRHVHWIHIPKPLLSVNAIPAALRRKLQRPKTVFELREEEWQSIAEKLRWESGVSRIVVDGQDTRMKEVLYRICWNDLDWTRPAGICNHESGFPGLCGYGHEEWNLNLEDSVDDCVYGYIDHVPSEINVGEKFMLGFWVHRPGIRGRYLVGMYLEAESSNLADDETLRNRIDNQFEDRGIYGRRADELFQTQSTPKDEMCVDYDHEPDGTTRYTWEEAMDIVISSVKRGFLRVRCRTDRVLKLDVPLLLPNEINGKRLHSYFRNPSVIEGGPFLMPFLQGSGRGTEIGPLAIQDADAKTETPTDSEEIGGSLGSTSLPSGRTEPHVIEKYARISRTQIRVITPRHKKLVNQFQQWLWQKGILPTLEA